MEGKPSQKSRRPMNPRTVDQPRTNTFWGDFWIQDKQLPSKAEFQAMAEAKIEIVKNTGIPINHTWERMNFDWANRLNQAAKLFAQAWLHSYEIYGREREVLKSIDMTKAQVADLIRKSQLCMTYKNLSRNGKDASRFFETLASMNAVTLMLYRPKEASILNTTQFWDRMRHLGNKFDRSKSWANLKGSEADYNMILANMMIVVPTLVQAVKWPQALNSNSFTKNTVLLPYYDESSQFKDAMKFACEEVKIRVIDEDWQKSDAIDVAIGAQGLMTPFTRIYTFYANVSRLMAEIERHADLDKLRNKRQAPSKSKTLVDLMYDDDSSAKTVYGQEWELYPFTPPHDDAGFSESIPTQIKKHNDWLEDPNNNERPTFQNKVVNEFADAYTKMYMKVQEQQLQNTIQAKKIDREHLVIGLNQQHPDNTDQEFRKRIETQNLGKFGGLNIKQFSELRKEVCTEIDSDKEN